MAFKVEIRGVEEAMAKVRGGLGKAFELAIEKLGLRGKALVQENIAAPFGGRQDAVSSGVLASSIDVEFGATGEGLSAIIFPGPPADVYGAPQEFGTRPHFPPPDALLLWVKKTFNIQDEKAAKSAAFLVARKIAKRGTPGHFMFQRAQQKLEEDAQGIVESVIGRELERQGLTP